MSTIDGKFSDLLAIDAAGLETEGGALETTAPTFRDQGAAVHNGWQALAPSYIAPEAPTLLNGTLPIMTFAGVMADDFTTVGKALKTFATEVKRLQELAKALMQEAADAEKAAADSSVVGVQADTYGNAAQGEGSVRNAGFEKRAAAILEEFERAQVACASVISPLVGGGELKFNNGDGVADVNEAGMTASDYIASWGGTSFDRSLPGGVATAFWKMVDGWKSLTTAEGWLGVYQFVASAALELNPLGPRGLNDYMALPGMPIGTSKEVLGGAIKGFFAADEWAKNPAGAAGQVLFNVATLGIGLTKVGSIGNIARTGINGLSVATRGVIPNTAAIAARIGEIPVPVPRLSPGLALAGGVRMPGAIGLEHIPFKDTGPGSSLLNRMPADYNPSAGGALPPTDIGPGHPLSPDAGQAFGRETGRPGRPVRLDADTRYDVVDQDGVRRGVYITDANGKIREVYLDAGQKGDWRPDTKFPLPNTTYHVRGAKTGVEYHYQTDVKGRLIGVKGELVYAGSDQARRGPDQTPTGHIGLNEAKAHNKGVFVDFERKHGRAATFDDVKDRLMPEVRHDGGHLIATVFDGPGDNINMVAMLESLNRSRKGTNHVDNWRKLEVFWEHKLRQTPPVKVEVDIQIEYSLIFRTPKAIRAEYWLDGVKYVERFSNRV